MNVTNHLLVTSWANGSGAINSGSANFTDASAGEGFTTTLGTNWPNLGIVGAAAAAADLHATINSVTSGTTVVLSTTAGTSVTTANWVWGNVICDTNSAGTTLVGTYTSAITGGDALVVGITVEAGTNVSSIVDTSGNVYSLKKTLTPPGITSKLLIYVALNVRAASAGSNTLTVTFSRNPFTSGNGNGGTMEAYEVTPDAGKTLLVDINVTNTGTSNSPSSGSFTTNYPNEILFAFPALESTVNTTTGGWTATPVNPYGGVSEFLIRTTIGTNTATFVTNASADWGVGVIGIAESENDPIFFGTNQ